MDFGPFFQGKVCTDRALSCAESGAHGAGAERAESVSLFIAQGK